MTRWGIFRVTIGTFVTALRYATPRSVALRVTVGEDVSLNDGEIIALGNDIALLSCRARSSLAMTNVVGLFRVR